MSTPPITRDSADWRPLKSWLITQIHNGQAALEATGRAASEYDVVRGRIAAFRQLICEVEPEVALATEAVETPVRDKRVGY